MPYMKMPGNLSYNFCAEEVEIPPQGVPVLILNIVDNMDVLNGEVMTKYDRIIKVEKYENFAIDIPDCLNELQSHRGRARVWLRQTSGDHRGPKPRAAVD